MQKYIISYVVMIDCDAYMKTVEFHGTPEELENKVSEMRNQDNMYLVTAKRAA